MSATPPDVRTSRRPVFAIGALVAGVLLLVAALGVFGVFGSNVAAQPEANGLPSTGQPGAGGNATTPTPGATTTAGPSAAKPSPTATKKKPFSGTPVEPVYTGGPLACPAFPAFPDQNCTGWRHTGVKLRNCGVTDSDGGTRLMTAGKTYSGCLFPGLVRIGAKNITIEKSEIQGSVAMHWTVSNYGNLMLRDVEINTGTPDTAAISAGNYYTCLRCYVHDTFTGVHAGSHVTIIDSYIGRFTYTDGAHQAAIGVSQGDIVDVHIIHNNLDCWRWNVPESQNGCSSALSLYDEPTLDGITVQHNLFNTAGGYCTYGGGPKGTHITYLDNRFGTEWNSTCGDYGPVAAFYASNVGNVWSGNTYVNGKAVVANSST